MMHHKMLVCLFLMAPLLTPVGAADTVYLKNGVRFDGIVHERPDGNLLVEADKRKIVFRAGEVDRVEQNDRTGVIDKEAAKARWAVRDAEMAEITGLTADQRSRVEALMYELRTPHAGDRRRIREKLTGLHAEMDIVPYLAYRLPEMSHRFSPWVLETIVLLDPKRGRAFARDYAFHEFAGTRAMSIELIGRLRDEERAGIVARGLVDHDPDVRIAAAYALAAVGARDATPALIELLRDADLKVANASRSALKSLWQEETAGRSLLTEEEWLAFYDGLASKPESTFSLGGLESLIPESEEFEDE